MERGSPYTYQFGSGRHLLSSLILILIHLGPGWHIAQFRPRHRHLSAQPCPRHTNWPQKIPGRPITSRPNSSLWPAYTILRSYTWLFNLSHTTVVVCFQSDGSLSYLAFQFVTHFICSLFLVRWVSVLLQLGWFFPCSKLQTWGVCGTYMKPVSKSHWSPPTPHELNQL